MVLTTRRTGATLTPTERVTRAYRRISDANRPEVWIHLRAQQDAVAEARLVEARLATGEQLPLAGRTVAVKDNIDVAGLPTTAACPAFAYRPDADAAAVASLRAAGAIVIGKANMDQFATGLVGTRSPYGVVRDARDPTLVSGGSSSGSAVAVALGMTDLGLATDTAGCGRVPAAFQGIVAIKPTRGTISTQGVVPACPSFDCVSIFARGLVDANAAVATMTAPYQIDRESVEPSVAAIILEAQSITVDTYREDLRRLEHYRQAVNETMHQFDALLVPTVPFQPTIQQVQKNPLEVNNHLGTYTTFCNVLDMCAVVLPAHEDGPQLGATLLGPAFHDALIANIAQRITDPGQQ